MREINEYFFLIKLFRCAEKRGKELGGDDHHMCDEWRDSNVDVWKSNCRVSYSY